MRIGTRNLGGRWGDQHRAFLRRRDCDVWLLTEVRTDVQLHGYQRTVTDAFMAEDRHWSAILSRSGLEESDDPHPTTVAAVVGDTALLVLSPAVADLRKPGTNRDCAPGSCG